MKKVKEHWIENMCIHDQNIHKTVATAAHGGGEKAVVPASFSYWQKLQMAFRTIRSLKASRRNTEVLSHCIFSLWKVSISAFYDYNIYGWDGSV